MHSPTREPFDPDGLHTHWYKSGDSSSFSPASRLRSANHGRRPSSADNIRTSNNPAVSSSNLPANDSYNSMMQNYLRPNPDKDKNYRNNSCSPTRASPDSRPSMMRYNERTESVVDSVTKLRLDAMEQKLQKIMEAPSSTSTVFELTKRIADRTVESAKQQRDNEDYFKKTMDRFSLIDNRITNIEHRLNEETSASIRTLQNDFKSIVDRIERIEDQVALEKEQRLKSDSHIDELEIFVKSLSRRLDDRLEDVKNDFRICLQEQQQEFKKENQDRDKRMEELAKNLNQLLHKYETTKTDHEKDMQSMAEVYNNFKESCDVRMSSIQSNMQDIDINWKSARDNSDRHMEDFEKKTNTCMEKFYEHLTLIRDDVETTQQKHRQTIEIIERRLADAAADSEDKISKYGKDNKQLHLQVDERIGKINNMMDERINHVNKTLGIVMNENDKLRSSIQETHDHYLMLKDENGTNQIAHQEKLDCLNSVQEGCVNKLGATIQHVGKLAARLDHAKLDIMEKARLRAMDVAETVVDMQDKSLRQDIAILCYWTQQCCGRLNLNPRGILSIPKRKQVQRQASTSPKKKISAKSKDEVTDLISNLTQEHSSLKTWEAIEKLEKSTQRTKRTKSAGRDLGIVASNSDVEDEPLSSPTLDQRDFIPPPRMKTVTPKGGSTGTGSAPRKKSTSKASAKKAPSPQYYTGSTVAASRSSSATRTGRSAPTSSLRSMSAGRRPMR